MSPGMLERIGAVIAGQPDAVAVVDGTRSYTYGQLAAAAGRVVAELRRQGVGAEDRVGLLAGRSFDQVAAVLGVLQAGAALVPLEVAHGPHHRQRITTDAGVRVVLAERGLDPYPAGPAVVHLPLAGRADEAATVSVVSGQQLAYVVYSSGSTGTPKGIDVAHVSIDNYTRWTTEAFALRPGDRVLNLASLGFDVGLWRSCGR